MSRRARGAAPGGRVRGAIAVEFALTVIIFLAMVIGVIDVSRLMYVWNAVVEAGRVGARVAVVCDRDTSAAKAAVRTQMKVILPALQDANITITYPADKCVGLACDPVSVRISGFTVHSMIPFVNLDWAVPTVLTTLSKESLDSATNAFCS